MESLKFSSSFSGHRRLCLLSPPRFSPSRRMLSFVVGSSETEKISASSVAMTEQSASLVKKSRGELFIEKALSERKNNSSRISSRVKDKKEKKDDYMALSKRRGTAVVGCYGCGATLQTEEEEAPGYVPLDLYEMKRKHHQLRTVLCGRCRSLAHGQMIPAVGGHGGYGGGKRFVSAEQLRVELSHLCNEKALIVKLVDIIDFNGSFLTRIRDIIGANPIVLVATKVDLLPKGTNLSAVGDWILEFIARKKLNVISVHLTSSKSLEGISSVAAYIRQQRQGRNVYILGSANVGKSAFVSAILQDFSKRDFAASAALRHLPIQSAMPGTTLGPIEIKPFTGGGSLFDTPGIHVHHRMAAVVSPSDLTLLAPRRRLQGHLIAPSIFRRGQKLFPMEIDDLPLKSMDEMDLMDNVSSKEIKFSPQLSSTEEEDETSLSGTSVLWGGIIRLDIIKAPPYVHFHVYGPNAISKEIVATPQADKVYKEQVGKKLTPPICKEEWAGLPNQQAVKLVFESWDKPACDIAISGLGWVTIESGYREFVADIDSRMMDRIDKGVEVVIHTPKSVEVFVRPSLPVGSRGYQWYDFRELSEKEQEARPKVYLP